MTGMANGRDDLMLGSDGQIARKKQHDADVAAQIEPTVPGVTRSVGRPKPDPARAGTVGAQVGLERLGSMLASAAPGAVIGTLGAPGDIVGFFKGLYDAATAEEGEGIDAFLTGMTEISESIGSEVGLKYIRDNIDMLPVRDDIKKAIIDGADIGSLFGLGGAITAGGKAIYQGGKKMMAGPSTVAKVDAESEMLAPAIIENPEAGPIDRSQLPPKLERPKAKPSEIDELGFVLKSLEVAKNLQQKRGTAQQFLKRLEQNGVSSEEIDALGLREKFSDPNERITRDQFVQTIRDRRIELEENIKTTEAGELAEGEVDDLRFGQGEVIEDPDEWNYRTEEYILALQRGSDPDEFEQVIERVRQGDRYNDEELAQLKKQIEEGDFTSLPSSTQSEFEDAADDLAREQYLENPFYKWSADEADYQIVGNDDIGFGVLYEGRLIDDEYHSSIGEAEIRARDHAYSNFIISDAPYGEAKFDQYMLPGGENYREILLRDPGTPTGGSPSHWSEDDVIGHVLAKDRVDAQGNKTLYAEEVQSDFAQSARPSVNEKRRMEMYKDQLAAAQKDVEFANEQIEQMRSQIRSIEESMAGMSAIEKTEAFKKIEAINKEIAPMESQAESRKRNIDYYQDSIAETETNIANRAEKVGKTRFVKDTQQWLRPTLKRLIAKAIEEGYDTVSVPPFQVVHERWNEDYGDFYRKSVPNTLLKVAKQLDPNAKLEYSDLVDSAYPELRGAAADRGVSAGTNGLDRTPTIKITPAMREAYQEKGQSLFVPGAATIVAGKLVVDKVTKEQEDDRAKATR